MARSEISADHITAYRQTDYRSGFGPDAIILRVDSRSEPLSELYASSGHRCAVFITAHNPFSETHSAEANDAAHARLRAELTRQTSHVIEGAGADPSGAWPEEKSFLALGVGLEASKALGTQFRQNAIVWAGNDAIPRLILLC